MAEQEPSIEEILASIRQIISDDEEPQRESDLDISATPEPAPAAAPPPPPAPEPEAKASFADVLDLTEVVEEKREAFDIGFEDHKERESDLDLSAKEEPKRTSDLDLSAITADADSIFTAPAAAATTAAFSRLIGNMPVEREENARSFVGGRITLEDIARDLLRPMLRQWVDENVPAIVERAVEKEIEKLSRKARD